MVHVRALLGLGLGLGLDTRGGARNSRDFTRARHASMLVLDIDYRPQCVAHALQVREFHSMLGRGARTSTFRVRVIYGGGCRFLKILLEIYDDGQQKEISRNLPLPRCVCPTPSRTQTPTRTCTVYTRSSA